MKHLSCSKYFPIVFVVILTICLSFIFIVGCEDQNDSDSPSSSCSHEDVAIKNAKTATCSNEGYTGDRVCVICDEIVQHGKIIPETSHIRSANATTGELGDRCSECGFLFDDTEISN